MAIYIPKISESERRDYLPVNLSFDNIKLKIVLENFVKYYDWLGALAFIGVSFSEEGLISYDCGRRTANSCFAIVNLINNKMVKSGGRVLHNPPQALGDVAMEEMERSQRDYDRLLSDFTQELKGENPFLYHFIIARSKLEAEVRDENFHRDHTLFIAKLVNNQLEARILEENLRS